MAADTVVAKNAIIAATSTAADRPKNIFRIAFVFGSDVERDNTGAIVLDAAGNALSITPLERYRRTLLGAGGYGPSQFTIDSGEAALDFRPWNAGWFAQDTWSASPQVTLTYGLPKPIYLLPMTA